MPSRILDMIKVIVSQLPKEKPKPQKPIEEPEKDRIFPERKDLLSFNDVKANKQSNIELDFF